MLIFGGELQRQFVSGPATGSILLGDQGIGFPVPIAGLKDAKPATAGLEPPDRLSKATS
jgi:hypothetical protein